MEEFHYPRGGDDFESYTAKQRYENLAVYRTLIHTDYNRDVTSKFNNDIIQLVPKNTATGTCRFDNPTSAMSYEHYPLYFNTKEKIWRWGSMVNGVIYKGTVYCVMREYKDLWDEKLRKLYFEVIKDDPALEFTYEMAGLSPRHFQPW